MKERRTACQGCASEVITGAHSHNCLNLYTTVHRIVEAEAREGLIGIRGLVKNPGRPKVRRYDSKLSFNETSRSKV